MAVYRRQKWGIASILFFPLGHQHYNKQVPGDCFQMTFCNHGLLKNFYFSCFLKASNTACSKIHRQQHGGLMKTARQSKLWKLRRDMFCEKRNNNPQALAEAKWLNTSLVFCQSIVGWWFANSHFFPRHLVGMKSHMRLAVLTLHVCSSGEQNTIA